ncbi:MAG: UDP-galactopyranose mutase [Anaerotruncus sp.]|nr:UDP-galactopyranose mutase [Anaerotruncus sp.]
MYDYLIVGAGLFGSVFACEANKAGKKCLVIDRRKHIGGNCFTEEQEDIQVHKYGAHIFRTSDKRIWDYISQYAQFNHFINSPIANYRGEIYNMPFNMNTFSKMWGISTPKEAIDIIEQQRRELTSSPKNLEEHVIQLVGRDIYEKLVKGYTEKQWGRLCTELPASIMRRLPVRFTYDNNYFNDPYQGIPKGGYTAIFKKLLAGCDVILEKDYTLCQNEFINAARKIIYTGTIDSYFNYCFGPLEYRSLRFETEVLDMQNYQGVAVVNYTDRETPYTRIIEHKHFEFGTQPHTVITREYPLKWTWEAEPYYPINDEKNQERYERYLSLASKEKNVLFGGRLGEYRYYDMQDTIISALNLAEKEI